MSPNWTLRKGKGEGNENNGREKEIEKKVRNEGEKWML